MAGEKIRILENFEEFKQALERKLSVSPIVIGYYQVIESDKNKTMIRASVGETGFEVELEKDEAEKIIDYLKRKGFMKIVKVVPEELFYS